MLPIFTSLLSLIGQNIEAHSPHILWIVHRKLGHTDGNPPQRFRILRICQNYLCCLINKPSLAKDDQFVRDTKEILSQELQCTHTLQVILLVLLFTLVLKKAFLWLAPSTDSKNQWFFCFLQLGKTGSPITRYTVIGGKVLVKSPNCWLPTIYVATN